MVIRVSYQFNSRFKSWGRLGRGIAGFTLTEVLVALFVMAVAMGLIIAPFMSAMGYIGRGRARTDAQQVARQAMDTINKELSQAMDIYLSPSDPAICAFILPATGVYPVQPDSSRVIRYWQILRNHPNETYDAGQKYPLTSATCWYDKYSPKPKDNKALATDDDARYIARTVLTKPLGLADLDVLERAVPEKDASSIINKQLFIALTPDDADTDVPVLKFTPMRQVSEMLQRDNENSYVFRSKYPLWEDGWSIAVRKANGSLSELVNPNPFTASTARPAGVEVDTRGGKVYFGRPASVSIAATPTQLGGMVVQDSETVVIGGQVCTRVTATPVGYQYSINYQTGQVNFDPAIIALAQPGTISYQAVALPADGKVIVTYSTRALISVSLTVSKRDSRTGQPQDVHLEQTVKLRNVAR